MFEGQKSELQGAKSKEEIGHELSRKISGFTLQVGVRLTGSVDY